MTSNNKRASRLSSGGISEAEIILSDIKMSQSPASITVERVQRLNGVQPVLFLFRTTTIDIKYQIWKFGVVFTDGVSKRIFTCILHNAAYFTLLYLSPTRHLRTEITVLVISLQTFLYLCWYTIMSLLGHYNNFFFACHLLDIAMGVKTLRTILSSVTHNGKQASGERAEPAHRVLFLLRPECTNRVSLSSLAAHDDLGLAGRGGVPLHRRRLHFLPQVLQQGRGGGRTGYEMRRHDDRRSPSCLFADTPSAPLPQMMRIRFPPQCYLFHMYVGVRAGGGIGTR